MTEPMSEDRLTYLHELHETATKAPWSADEDDRIVRIHGTAWWTAPQFDDLIPPQCVTMQIAKIRKHDDQYQPYWPYPKDLRMIIEGRNAFGELLDEIDRLRDREHQILEVVQEMLGYFEIKKLGRARIGRESILADKLSSLLESSQDQENEA